MKQLRAGRYSVGAALAAGILALCSPAWADDEVLQPAALIGITEGSVYTRPAKPRWYDAAGTQSRGSYSKNSGPWLGLENGQSLSDGGYEVKIKTKEVSSEASTESSISFTVNTAAEQALILTNSAAGGVDVEIEYTKGLYNDPYAPVYVLWAEDVAGNFLHDLYVCHMAATNRMGSSDDLMPRPQALPYWFHKAGAEAVYGSDSLYLADPPDTPHDLDAVTGATADAGFLLQTKVQNMPRKITLLFEINQSYDTGWYFTAYPDFSADPYYKGSEEPSLIYICQIDFDSPQPGYTFELAGFGHYAGRTGSLYTDFSAIDPDDGLSKNKFEQAILMVDSLTARVLSAGSTTSTTAAGTSSTTTTTAAIVDSPCPAEKILGPGSRWELEALRKFRDRHLKRSPAGRALIRLYYAHSSKIARIVSGNPELAQKALHALSRLARHFLQPAGPCIDGAARGS